MQTSNSFHDSSIINEKIPINSSHLIIHKINNFRFNHKTFNKSINELIKNNNDINQKHISFPNLKRFVKYDNENILNSFLKYINENVVTNQFLEDFYFFEDQNEIFNNICKNTIKNKKKIGLNEKNSELLEVLQKEIPSKLYCGYYFEKFDLNEIENELILILLEEFITYSDQKYENLNENIKIENNNEKIKEKIPFLNNEFNSICINIDQIDNLNNIYILLYNKEYSQIKKISNTIEQQIPKNIPLKKQENNKNIHIIPKTTKYDYILKTHLQIPRSSIVKLVNKMDTNLDGKITRNDIKLFCTKNYIFYEDQFIDEIFLEAASKRIAKINKSIPIDNIDPLTISEIHNAIRYNLQKKQDLWIEIGRPYRDIWLLFLSKIGENISKKKFMPELCIRRIEDLSETNIISSSNKKKKKNQVKICDIPEKYKASSFNKPEANLVINNTQNIREIDFYDNDNTSLNDFEKVINTQFIKSVDNSCIAFDTKKYYDEALKLSKNYLKINDKNPILTFVPETDFDPKLFKKDKETENKNELLIQNDFENKNFIDEFEFGSYDNIRMPSLEMTEKTFPTKNSIMLPRIVKKEKIYTKTKKKNKEIFFTAIKTEDCNIIKQKFAKLQPIKDKYHDPKNHMFRAEEEDYNKPLYRTRFKCDLIENPYNISQHDLRPKELLLKEERKRVLKQQEEENKINKFLKIEKKSQPWVRYHKKANLARKEGFIDFKKPAFLQRGEYIGPQEILINMYRNEDHFENDFKLTHRQLRKTDKNKYL